MVIWNALEDLRRRENRRRGYVEVKTPLLYDEHTYVTSGHLQNYEENIFWVVGHEDDARRFALKPMNCPGHMLLFGSAPAQLPRAAASLRGVFDAAPRREGRTLHGLLRVEHITQDDAHVFVTEDHIQDEIAAMVDFVRYLYDLFGLARACRALDAPGETARHRRAMGPGRGGARSRR